MQIKAVHSERACPPPRKVDLIVFDLDGTLIDSRKDIAGSINHTLVHFGLRELDEEAIYGFIGRGVTSLLKESLASLGLEVERFDSNMVVEGRGVFLAHYGEHLLDHTRLYPGVETILRRYSGKRLAILTNKPEDLSRKILEGLRVADRFAGIYGGETFPFRKPDPRTLLNVLSLMNVPAERASFVGDSIVDMETGAAAGVYTIAVAYGLGSREDLVAGGPDALVEKIEELPQYLA